MGDSLTVTLHASASEAASGSGTASDLQTDDVPLRRALYGTLIVSAVSGSIVVTIETSEDSATWETIGTFTSASATETQDLWCGEARRYIRTSWTITGGPVTFALTATAYQTFCTLEQLVSLGGASDILTSAVSTAERVKHLEACTALVRGYLSQVGTLPILGVGNDVARVVAQIAIVDIITSDTGPHPDDDATELLLKALERAFEWLDDVVAGRIDPDVTFSDDDSENALTNLGGGVVYGDAQRDWSDALP